MLNFKGRIPPNKNNIVHMDTWIPRHSPSFLHLISTNSKVTLLFTPPKINIEPENDGLEDVSPFPGVHFQVPC